MSGTWMTKYGPRRVRYEPPTLAEALFAAEDLALDKAQQIEIAAELMRKTVAEIKVEAEKIMRERARRVEITPAPRRAGGQATAVVVERKAPRRVTIEFKKGAPLARNYSRSV